MKLQSVQRRQFPASRKEMTGLLGSRQTRGLFCDAGSFAYVLLLERSAIYQRFTLRSELSPYVSTSVGLSWYAARCRHRYLLWASDGNWTKPGRIIKGLITHTWIWNESLRIVFIAASWFCLLVTIASDLSHQSHWSQCFGSIRGWITACCAIRGCVALQTHQAEWAKLSFRYRARLMAVHFLA